MPSAVDREGDFKTSGGRAWIEKAKEPSQAVAIVVEFPLVAHKQGNEWIGWAEYDQVGVARYWFISKVGGINQMAVDTLKDVLGFDGDIENIENWTPNDCQVVVENREWNGKTRMEVRWTNPIDWDGGSRFAAKADDLKDLNRQYGSQIRGAFKSSTAPPKPPKTAARAVPTAAKPAVVPKPPPPKPTQPAASAQAAQATAETAWEAFAAAIGTKPALTQEYVAEQWFRFIEETGKPQESFTGDDWAALTKRVADLLPF